MVVTFSSILAAGWRARAEEPPRYAGAVRAGEPSRPTPEDDDGGLGQPPESKAPPVETKPTSPGLPGAAENAEAVAAPPGPAEPAVAPDEENGKGKKKKGSKAGKKDNDKDRDDTGADRARFGSFELKGRVYARSEYDRRKEVVTQVVNDMAQDVARTIDSLDLSVPTARVSLHYHAPMEWLTAVAEIDISGKPDMKDGYVQAKDTHFVVRAGQFKMPVSAMEATSPWTLPMVRRGLLHDVLTDRMDSGGRRPGVIVGYRDRSIGLHPRLTLGAFQGSYLAGVPTLFERDTDLLNAQKLMSQSFVGRAEVGVLGAEVGVYYENRRSPFLDKTNRYWMAGGDIYYDRLFETGGVRVWIDGMAGSSWYEHDKKTPDGKDAMFVAARALVAYRFGGTADEAFYVEPYALGAAIDLDAQVTADLLWEGVLGVNVGYWKRARLTLQGEINKGQRNFPGAVFGGPPPDRLGLILQAGVAF